jgi:mandelate racemase
MKYLVSALNDMNEVLAGHKLAPAEIYEKTRKSLHFVGYGGLSMIAVSGVDMAIWDALARAAQMPLCTLLGGTPGPVQAYNSNGLWLNAPEDVAAEAVDLKAEGQGAGFKGLKLRLGRDNRSIDLETIAAVRDAVGPTTSLMVDYNQGLSLAEAMHRTREIDDEGLEWIEEPIVYDNFDGYAALRADLKTPLMVGENFYGPRDMHLALRAGVCDLVMPDFMRIGGVTGWMRAAGIAGAWGVPMSTHLYPEVAAHVMRVTETAHWLEWQSWADPVLQEPYALCNGDLIVPDKPGLGLDWDEAVVAANLIE